LVSALSSPRSALKSLQRSASSGVSAKVARIIARRVGCSDTEAGVSSNATGIS
jgi:hypothetical protein